MNKVGFRNWKHQNEEVEKKFEKLERKNWDYEQQTLNVKKMLRTTREQAGFWI